MTLATLSRSWTRVESSLPVGWRLRGIELPNSFAKQGDAVPPDVWHAWASEHRHSEGSELYGSGPTPTHALDDLATKLRGFGADPPN